MSRPLHISAGVGAVATALVVATLAGPGVAAGASHAKATTPTLKVVITKSSTTVNGPKTFQAGRIDLSIKAVGGERTFDIVQFKPGYDLQKLRSDLGIFFKGSNSKAGPTKSDIKHLDNAVKNTTFYGGLDATPGQAITGSLVLPKAGTYYLYNDPQSGLPNSAVKLTVTGPVAHRPAPKSSATVTATSAKQFGGASTLPAKGTITFKNVSDNSPHFLVMLHVKDGTTKKDVLNAFMNNDFSIFEQGQVETDVVDEGLSETVSYSVPAGTYAELCFFPDLQTGIPHAFMGMIKIVTLK